MNNKKCFMGFWFYLFGTLAVLLGQDNFSVFRGSQILYNFSDAMAYNIPQKELKAIAAKYGYYDLNPLSPVSLNDHGYYIYEKGQYEDSLVLFRAATAVDPSYSYPHYNLACVLGLLNAAGKKIEPKELVYHLQMAGFLMPAWFDKMKNDTDLNSVRTTPWFKDFKLLLESGRLEREGNKVFLNSPGSSVFICSLIEENIGPLFITPQAEESPTSNTIAVIAEEKGKIGVYLLTPFGLIMKMPESKMTLGSATYCNLIWEPQGKGLLFYVEGKLQYFELSNLRIRTVLQCPIENKSDYIYEIAGYRFLSANLIRFMGGSSLEHHFSGIEYQIGLDGMGLQAVPGGKVIESESWQ